MEADVSYYLNPVKHKKVFDITALVSACRFSAIPPFEPHWEKYNFAQVFLIFEGTGIYATEHGTYPLKGGTMLYRPAFEASRYEWTSPTARFELISFVCDSPAMKEFEGGVIELFEEEQAILHDVIQTGARVCAPFKESESLRGMRVKDNTPDVVLGFVVASLERFLSMVYCRRVGIGLLTDESQKVNTFIEEQTLTERVKRYLSENVDKSLTVSDVCARFGMSQTGLMRKFRRDTGSSLMEYFTSLKIDEAKRRIAKTPARFTEIADSLGFSSVNYFSKVFKSRVGMTPTAYSRYASKRRSGG
ncbi:MAG: helix-turn-helix transcriptional regulator [Clostridia bacterium]|nr:helix-turn-helix transcriptional regulator [Clostridia bacterium]